MFAECEGMKDISVKNIPPTPFDYIDNRAEIILILFLGAKLFNGETLPHNWKVTLKKKKKINNKLASGKLPEIIFYQNKKAKKKTENKQKLTFFYSYNNNNNSTITVTYKAELKETNFGIIHEHSAFDRARSHLSIRKGEILEFA